MDSAWTHQYKKQKDQINRLFHTAIEKTSGIGGGDIPAPSLIAPQELEAFLRRLRGEAEAGIGQAAAAILRFIRQEESLAVLNFTSTAEYRED